MVGATLAFLAVKLLDRLRRRDAESEAQMILERARIDSANLIKEAELQVKEESIQQKAEMDRELNKLRDQLRERERSLDKRQEAVEQQTEYLRKQERIVEVDAAAADRKDRRHGKTQSSISRNCWICSVKRCTS